MKTTERKKRVNILRFADVGTGEVWLQHSAKGKSPDVEGEGWYRPHSSRVWAKAGAKATWRETPYTNMRHAMDDMLGGPKTAEDAVAMLVSGVKIQERKDRGEKYKLFEERDRIQ